MRFLKKTISIITISSVIMGIMASSAFAAETKYYDKGRSYSKYLEVYDKDVETAVASVSAVYDPVSQVGRERVRLWGRSAVLEAALPGLSFAISKAKIVFVAVDSRASNNPLMITGSSPVKKLSSYTLPVVIYDILNWKNIYTNTISSLLNMYTNNITTTGTDVTDQSAYEKTILFHSVGGPKGELPSSIKYGDVDSVIGNTTSGISAEFQYNLLKETKNFYVSGQGYIQYWSYATMGGGSIYLWSGTAGITHTVN
ncbi:hypothetical protein AB4Z45_32830 [Paenibacillus sp. MCAF9]|uniref:hypothetical protein n=1 Tax=unclassified Paenibacillus TaxID=185978 RepID=UPI003F9DF112